MKLPSLLGRIAYIATYPGLRLVLYNTKRAYVWMTVKNEVLLTKNWLGLQTVWRLPGGGVRDDETPLQAVMREVKEELGIELESHQLVQLTDDAFKASKGYTYDLFVCRLDAKPNVLRKEIELLAAAWFLCSDLPQEISEHVAAARHVI